MREILFQNALLTVRSFNILLAVGFLFTGTYIIRYVERYKMNLNFLTQYFAHIIIAALVVGRLAFVLEHLSRFIARPASVLYVWDMNFSFFGILAGAIGMLYWLTRKKKEDFWEWFDALFLSILAMLIFVHVGYFFSGQNYGLPTDLPWGITFDASHIPFISPIHPTQLYAAVLAALLLVYSNIKGKRIHLSGVIGTRALMVYALGMLGIDFLHGDPSMYVKIAYGITATLAFIAQVHCSHKTHITK
jgi:phosphatidylglycerol:prolipoprotein diacylglycerol transferase